MLPAFLVVTLAFASPEAHGSDLTAPYSTANSPRVSSSIASIDLERGKLELERQKLGIEEKKVWIAAVATAVPLLVAVATLGFQLRSAQRMKVEEAKLSFELKAAELVLGSYSPHAALNRAKLLEQMFPTRLPSDFADQFPADRFPGTKIWDLKSELLDQLSKYPSQRSQIIKDWKKAYPNDSWLDDFKTSL